jgi:hypothetical protein
MLSIETVRKAGAILPSNKDLEAALVGVIQFCDLHQPEEIFHSTLFFLNQVELNQNKPAKYLPTWSQFESVKNDLVSREILVEKSGKLYHHPDIQKLIDQDLQKNSQTSKKRKKKKGK